MTTYTVEHTDTFGGEANYCWANRYTITEDERKPLSRLALVRRAKSLCGMSGVRCQVTDYGDMIEIRPAGLCQVIFVTVEY